ncbi:hypothetical protein T440DRAFT_53068 [Plenodomus tracheiphilus IPT5]|uniref:Uncharacterized protein n=1 Tax=Plenodomus tracheiphilus IPT5 TaxID=1408161 RepID=A0A6A7APJ3_9PLEO|nr:hypothetical protein T440DRAFT_79659 [Plenodomus tracheiphilus IPT5]KAF2844079.1 hypothetical protein T440DRAFT_53068 [Plenodomus tracheiphilus IPT5]
MHPYCSIKQRQSTLLQYFFMKVDRQEWNCSSSRYTVGWTYRQACSRKKVRLNTNLLIRTCNTG